MVMVSMGLQREQGESTTPTLPRFWESQILVIGLCLPGKGPNWLRVDYGDERYECSVEKIV